MPSSSTPEAAAATATPQRRRPRGLSRRPAFWFIAPSVIALLTIGLAPILFAVWNSLHEYNLARPMAGKPFVGLENYAHVLGDGTFWSSLGRTLGFLVTAVPIEIAIGLWAALLLHRPGLGFMRALARVSLVIPMATTYAVVGLIGRLVFNREFGVANEILGWVGIPTTDWLGDPTRAYAALVIMDVWQWTPFCTLILLAGLSMVPRETEEAARLETPSAWRILRHVQLPYLLPGLTAILILRTADILKEFDKIFTMTRGGPGSATELISVYIQRIAFRVFDQGTASAQAILLLVLCIVLSRLYIRYVYREAEQ
ncbi:carbohydrate ABC transporter permease [Sediminicurvatus halobius]|uniref:Sugar ABC transporter permease n=1 Tax=Sediminicurvatus halobius TaxID=2182432 RepID=A0A2U2N154_9GAMM|nr:sugar ABC transporter permease [Spiribacter halobius]PWG62792.1 sugar ABC transporter permease [Spiribacter halobius]UEX77061.1 sugar ABC transporter permease [Spiribacter halobius]